MKQSLPVVSPFQKFVAKWEDCDRCKLSQTRTRVALARGSVPADVVFIGEAPGESDNVVGKPFAGPTGRLLDHIIKESLGGVRSAITNLVACIPVGEDGSKTLEIEDECVEACGDRLIEFMRLCNPKLIVTVGKLAGEWLDQSMKHAIKVGKVSQLSIQHPGQIQRSNITQRGLLVQKTIIAIRNAWEDVCSS